jgi:hypothetical protein
LSPPFEDGVVENYSFVFKVNYPEIGNSWVYENPIDLERSHPAWFSNERPRFGDAGKPLCAVRSLISKRHWAHPNPGPNFGYAVASQAVAKRLNKLILPIERKSLYFMPVLVFS